MKTSSPSPAKAAVPMRVGQIMDRALRLTPKMFGSLVIWIVVLSGLNTSLQFPEVAGSVWLVIPTYLASLILSVAFYFITIFFASDAWLGNELSTEKSLKRISFGLMLRTITLSLKIGLITVLGLLLLVLPGLIYAMNRFMALYILILDNTSSNQALTRSKFLMTRGKWYRIDSPPMRLTAIGILIIILYAIFFGLGGGLLGVGVLKDWGSVSQNLWFFVIQIITSTCGIFSSICFVGFYYDLAARYEGSDIMAELERISGEPANPAEQWQ